MCYVANNSKEYFIRTANPETDVPDLWFLYLEAEWDTGALDEVPDWITPAWQGSVAAVVACDKSTGRVVGMARAIGDGVSDAYIQDVAVTASWRKNGIGGAMVQELLKMLKELDCHWIGLIGQPGTGNFYKELGFEEMGAHLPMHFANRENRENNES